MKKPSVGQVIYSLNIGNAARRAEQELTEFVVIKVGRKYFYACAPRRAEYEHMWRRYYIDTWIEDNGDFLPESRLYETKQQFEDERECARLAEEIYSMFVYGRYAGDADLNSIRTAYTLLCGESK